MPFEEWHSWVENTLTTEHGAYMGKANRGQMATMVGERKIKGRKIV